MLSKVLPTVVELVVPDPERVVAHGDHHLDERFAFGELGEHPGEHIAGIEKENGITR